MEHPMKNWVFLNAVVVVLSGASVPISMICFVWDLIPAGESNSYVFFCIYTLVN